MKPNHLHHCHHHRPEQRRSSGGHNKRWSNGGDHDGATAVEGPVVRSKQIRSRCGGAHGGGLEIRDRDLRISISVTTMIESVKYSPETASKVQELRRRYDGKTVVLGVDDMDMMFKGISLKFLAFGKLLEDYPVLRGSEPRRWGTVEEGWSSGSGEKGFSVCLFRLSSNGGYT
ncbi:hypothetical protein E3N88_00528 [Mikania micrantha]|uniref:Uncharacterized protein n=1 Tax=Mikania micrantha TaxID=192012 RepID=A0A5N6PYP5_9ASTR|nr:hypothetical protein E3N88_00528 [Mikania micrantha]